MPIGEMVLLGTMGFTAIVSTLFTIYMLKLTVWDETEEEKEVRMAETHKIGC